MHRHVDKSSSSIFKIQWFTWNLLELAGFVDEFGTRLHWVWVRNWTSTRVVNVRSSKRRQDRFNSVREYHTRWLCTIFSYRRIVFSILVITFNCSVLFLRHRIASFAAESKITYKKSLLSCLTIGLIVLPLTNMKPKCFLLPDCTNTKPSCSDGVHCFENHE